MNLPDMIPDERACEPPGGRSGQKSCETAKQREIRLRGARILDLALSMVREGGMAAINMETISRQMNCTRGTIYKHFANKEDILIALATRSVRRRMELFHFAMTLGNRPRQRCSAIGIAAEVYVDHLPDDFLIEQYIRHDPVWSKSSPRQRAILSECERACIDAIGGVVGLAIETGDLPVDVNVPPEALVQQIVFGLWSLVYGGLVLESTSPSLGTAGIANPRQAIRANCNAMLDAIGWAPAHRASDYDAFVDEITPRLIEYVK